MNTKGKKFTDMDKFRKILKDEGLKATPQRLAVHEAMMALIHASADMVQDYIAANCGTEITAASVYNILENLATLGVYSTRLSANNKKYYDINSFNHVHLYDSQGHEFRDLADDEVIGLVESHFKGRKFRGYKIDSINIQVVVHPTRRKGGKTA